MKTLLKLNSWRFVSCARVMWLLHILSEIAHGNFLSSLMNQMNLTRSEVFRGKISPRKNQTKQTDLEERTRLAPNP
jgi:hypothetical protein